MVQRFLVALFVSIGMLLGLRSSVQAQTVADLTNDFSSIQGLKGWTYGYYTSLTNPATFSTANMSYNATNSDWEGALGSDHTPRATSVGGHPGEGPLYPSVHRWTSTFAGTVAISGTLAKLDTRGGDGVTGQIYINGQQVYSQAVAYNDSTGYNYRITATLHVNDTVDFAIQANANYLYDSTKFTGTITVLSPAAISSLTLNPTSVSGGNSSTATLTLTGPAIAGGQVIALFSSTTAAQVPATLTVPAGATSATFPVMTVPVTGTVATTISASYDNGPAASATLTVTAPTLTAMALTPAGVSAGFQLSTFATGFPYSGANVGPVGIAFEGGRVLVTDQPGNVRVFPSDTDGQNAANVTVAHNYGTGNGGGTALLNGILYMAEPGNNKVVQLNADGTYNQDIVTGLTNAVGMVANPFTGHLFVSSGGAGSTIWDVNPLTKTYTVWLSGLPGPDGLALSSDGRTLFAAFLSGNDLGGFDTTTKAEVFDYRQLNPGTPLSGTDGIAVGSGALAGNLYVNVNGGQLYQIATTTGAATLLASGGSRGDFVTADPNGTLLITQTDRLLRLTPAPGGSFANITSSLIYARNDLSSAPYPSFNIVSPQTGADASQTASFDINGITGNLWTASMQRGGQLSWNSIASFDTQMGLRSMTNSNLVSLGPVGAAVTTATSPQPYTYIWSLPAAFLSDLQSQWGGSAYAVKLTDLLSSTVGSYTVTDTPEQNASTINGQNLLTFVVSPSGNPPIPQGRSQDLTLAWTDAPLNGTWEILLNQTVLASSTYPSGWNVQPDTTGYNGALVSVPASAAIASGYEVRASSYVNSAGFFDVVASTGSPTAPVLASLTLSPNPVVGGNSVTGTVSVDKAAPSGGIRVTLSCASPSITLPTSVLIPSGQTSATFTLTTQTTTIPYATAVFATYNGTLQAILVVKAGSGSPPLAPTNLTATGGPSKVTLNWTASARTDSYLVNRSPTSGGPYTNIAWGVPTTQYVDTAVTNGTTYYYVVAAVNIYGQSPNSNQASATPRAPISVSGLVLNPTSVVGTQISVATITLTSVAPPGGVTVYPGSSNTAVATVPASLLVPAGAISANFIVSTSPVAANTAVSISAFTGIPPPVTATLTVNKPSVVSVTLSPNAVVGGTASTATVTLNAPAPTGGSTVTVSSNNTSVATVTPTSVSLAAGATWATFTVNTTSVTATTSATITATASSACSGSASAVLTINPSQATAYSINCGGSAVGSFAADTYFSGGSAVTTAATIDTTTVTNAAPASVYQSARESTSSFTYTFPGLNPGAFYLVRLHFADFESTAEGQREFNVSINGTQVLTNFDPFGVVDALNQAVIREFNAVADGNGHITVMFSQGAIGSAMCNGIEVVSQQPLLPTNLETYSTGSGKITLYWDIMPGAIGYNVYRGTTSGGEDYAHPVNGTTLVTSLSYSGSPKLIYTDTGLSNGVEYFYTTKAIYSIGISAPSNEDSEFPDPNGIPWDSRNPATILAAFRAAFSPDEPSIPTLRVMGPDRTMYDDNNTNAQLPDAVGIPGTNLFTLPDNSTLVAPLETDLVPSTQTDIAPNLSAYLDFPETYGPTRRVCTTAGWRGVTGDIYLPRPNLPNPNVTIQPCRAA